MAIKSDSFMARIRQRESAERAIAAAIHDALRTTRPRLALRDRQDWTAIVSISLDSEVRFRVTRFYAGFDPVSHVEYERDEEGISAAAKDLSLDGFRFAGATVEAVQ